MTAFDPSSAADVTRSQRNERLVEAINIVPTVLDALHLPAREHRVEGRGSYLEWQYYLAGARSK